MTNNHPMRIPLLILSLCALLCGCETVSSDVSSDGTVSRWDADGTMKAVDGALRTWQTLDNQKRIIGYSPQGYPIFANP